MPNILKLAIVAAGGPKVVGPHFGVAPKVITVWQQRLNFPADKLDELCRMGGQRVRPDEIVQAMAEHAAERARAKVLAKAAGRCQVAA